MRYRDWLEFAELQGTAITLGWLKAVLRTLGKLQDEEASPPKHVYLDDNGWAVLPPEWAFREMEPLRLVFRRLEVGRRHPAIEYTLVPGPQSFGQAAVESAVLEQLPTRLAQPFAGLLQVEIWTTNHRIAAKQYETVVAWEDRDERE